MAATQIILFALSLVISSAAATRILDELPPIAPIVGAPAATATAVPGGAAAAVTGPAGGAVGPATTGPPGGAVGAATTGPAGAAVGAATIGPVGGAVGAATTGPAGGAAGVPLDGHPTLTFFMHDILGGSNPTAKAVTGIVANPAVSGQIPFAKPSGAVLPTSTGVPQNNGNSALINNNNLPFLVGLSGTTQNINTMQNTNGNNNMIFGGTAGFPVVNGAQLQSGTTLQKLMFGTLTAIDDELTEGPELGSGTVGKAQGLYVASSVDGTSQVLAFTAMFETGGYIDSLVFFGIHRTPVSQSQLAIMGGTGKYVNAKGFAMMKILPSQHQVITDGFETLVEFAVYLTY